MDLLEIDGGFATIRLDTDELRALALACRLTRGANITELAPDRPTQEARAMLYETLTCLFESLAVGATAFEAVHDYIRKDVTVQAVRRGWLPQHNVPADQPDD